LAPHAPAVPTTAAFAGQYRYDAATLTSLYAEGRELLTSADVNERQAVELLAQVDALHALAARQRVQAADRFRLLRLAELDAVTPEGAQWPAPAPQVPQAEAPSAGFQPQPSICVHLAPADGSQWGAACDEPDPVWRTSLLADVTCPACQGSPLAAELRGRAWAPQDGDTERLPRVPAEVTR
jgi:hypothetical protein